MHDVGGAASSVPSLMGNGNKPGEPPSVNIVANQYPKELLSLDPAKQVAFTVGMNCPVATCTSTVKYQSPEILQQHWNMQHWSKIALWKCAYCTYKSHMVKTMLKHLASVHPACRSVTQYSGQIIAPGDTSVQWSKNGQQSFKDPKGVWVNFDKYLKQFNIKSVLPSDAFDDSFRPHVGST